MSPSRRFAVTVASLALACACVAPPARGQYALGLQRLPPVDAYDVPASAIPASTLDDDLSSRATPTALFIPPSAEHSAYLPEQGTFGPTFSTPAGPSVADCLPLPCFSWHRVDVPLPPGARAGMLQRSLVRWTYLGGEGASAMQMNDATVQTTLAIPPFFHNTPLLYTPYFTFHMLAGPEVVDVPARLYDVSLEVKWMNQLTPRLGVEIAVAPSLFTDFDNDESDAFRMTGRAAGLWNVTDRTQIALGGVYLGRQDVIALPIVGVIFGADVDSDTRWELIFPRPRIAHRVTRCGLVEDWLYVMGELGGNSWAVERAAGFGDLLTYRDYRLILGWERKNPDAIGGRLEAGYVFGRELEYKSSPTVYDLDSTFMVRAEASF